MVTQEKFAQLQRLPFVNKKFVASELIKPIVFKLAKDQSVVTIVPVRSHKELPRALIEVICREFNHVVHEGRTYPYELPMEYDDFVEYWFSSFVAVLLVGDFASGVSDEADWENLFLGNFYVKPNYPGRCLHVCNAGFIVNHNKRGLGLGKELGAKYLHYAPLLGYVYSVFNLVFETNVASLRIWDNLGFERIGYVKNVAVLKGEDHLVGAHVYGKDLV